VVLPERRLRVQDSARQFRSSQQPLAQSPLTQASIVGVPGSGVQAALVGLRFPRQAIPFDTWRRMGSQIARMADSSAWYLGDWLAYGEYQYSERYRRAVDVVGLNYQTLRNYVWIARRFPLSRRRDKLTFNHHVEVAKLTDEEQDKWFDRAIEQGWSVRQLRQNLKEEGEAENGKISREQTALPPIKTDQRRLERWRTAARQANKSFDRWVVAALDQAASQQLDDTTK